MSGMTWFFSIVIVAVIGVVAVVATGRGGSMAQTYDDRPDSLVPAGTELTARDLRRVRFSTAFRGYRMAEVDALLDRLAAEVEARDPDRIAEPTTPGSDTPGLDDEDPQGPPAAEVETSERS